MRLAYVHRTVDPQDWLCRLLWLHLVGPVGKFLGVAADARVALSVGILAPLCIPLACVFFRPFERPFLYPRPD